MGFLMHRTINKSSIRHHDTNGAFIYFLGKMRVIKRSIALALFSSINF